MAFTEKKKLLELSPDKIVPNPAQPRLDFPQDELLQLAESIRQNGVLQPILVRRDRDRYILVAKPSRPLCRSFLRRTARCWRLLKICSAVT